MHWCFPNAARCAALATTLLLVACGGGGGAAPSVEPAAVDTDGRVDPFPVTQVDGAIAPLGLLVERAAEVSSISGAVVVAPDGTFRGLPVPEGAAGTMLIVSDAAGTPLAMARVTGNAPWIDVTTLCDALVLMTTEGALVRGTDREAFVALARAATARQELERLAADSVHVLGTVFDEQNGELLERASECASEAWDRLGSLPSTQAVMAAALTSPLTTSRGVHLAGGQGNVVAVSSSLAWYGLSVVDVSGQFQRDYLIRPKERLNKFVGWKTLPDTETRLDLPEDREYRASVNQGLSLMKGNWDPATAAGKASVANTLTFVRILLEQLELGELLEYEAIERIVKGFEASPEMLAEIADLWARVSTQSVWESLRLGREFLVDHWDEVKFWIFKAAPHVSKAFLEKAAIVAKVAKWVAKRVTFVNDFTNYYLPFFIDVTLATKTAEFCFTVTPAGDYLQTCRLDQPAADIRWSPLAPAVGDVVRFDASATVDDDYATLQFRWDLDGDGTWDTPLGPTWSLEHTFIRSGNVDVRLEATDGGGAVGEATRRIYVAPAPVAAPPPGANPTLTGVSPNPAPTKDGTQTLTLLGTNFASGSTATFKDLTFGGIYAGKPTVFVSAGKLLLSANLTSSPASWTVQVIAPSGAASNTVAFTVAKDSAPTVSSVSPSPVPGKDGNQTITINGSGFVSGCTATLEDLTNGGTFAGKPTTFTSGSKVSVSANVTNVSASWSIEIVNPSGARSAPHGFSVVEAGPSISSVSPSPVPGKNVAQTFTINGSGFKSGCTATLKDLTNGGTFSGKATTFTSESKVSISANFTTAAATWTVQVINPGGSGSTAYAFTVTDGTEPTPTITSVSPSPVAGSDVSQSLTINGTGFVSGCTATLKDLTNGGTFSGKATAFTNSTKVAISANFTNAAATWTVEIVNPSGKKTAAYSFTVTETAPTISSVSPSPVPGKDSSQTLTVNGSFFKSGCTATLKDLTNGGTFSGKATTFTSAGKVSLSANFTNASATWTVEIVNPSGKKSSAYSFSVTATGPTITSVSPSPVPGKDSSQTLTVNGTNFVSGCTATLKDLTNGGTFSGKATTFTNSGKVSLTANFTNAAATWTVEIVNPNGKKSSAYSFTVTETAPSINSGSPSPVLGQNASQTLTINGADFKSGCTATLKDLTNGGTYSGKATTFTSSGKVSISANFTNVSATWSVEIVNPSGKKSAAFNFSVVKQ